MPYDYKISHAGPHPGSNQNSDCKHDIVIQADQHQNDNICIPLCTDLCKIMLLLLGMIDRDVDIAAFEQERHLTLPGSSFVFDVEEAGCWVEREGVHKTRVALTLTLTRILTLTPILTLIPTLIGLYAGRSRSGAYRHMVVIMPCAILPSEYNN